MNWTLPKACAEFGVSRDTIKRGLVAAGEQLKPGKAWPTRTIVQAIYTDGKTERARLTRAQADREELEVAQLRRELVTMAEVTALIRTALQPVRDGLVNMPASLAVRCNPSDPPMAMAALREGVDNMLRGLREEDLPKVLDGAEGEK